MAQDVTIADRFGNRRIVVEDDAHMPSWSAVDDGSAVLELERAPKVGWLSIKLTERRHARSKSDRGTEKVTMLTLDKQTADALRAALEHLYRAES